MDRSDEQTLPREQIRWDCSNARLVRSLHFTAFALTCDLSDRCWIINQRGYANLIPSSGDCVRGFIYELNPKDEAALDKYEGAPRIYEKRTIPVQLATKKTIDALVYIDFVSTSPDAPKPEYIHRINMGLQDALEKGISQSYIDKYIRRFIPPVSQ